VRRVCLFFHGHSLQADSSGLVSRLNPSQIARWGQCGIALPPRAKSLIFALYVERFVQCQRASVIIRFGSKFVETFAGLQIVGGNFLE